MALVTLPASPAPAQFTRRSLTSVGVARSPWTLVEQVQQNQGQQWLFNVELPPMNDAQARAWWAAMLKCSGPVGTFLFGDPRWKTPQGTWAGSPAVNGGGQEGQSLALSGMSAGATGKAGDYFQLGAGANARLYMLTDDFTADGAGEATVQFWPRLRISPGSADSVITASPQGVFRLVSGEVAQSWRPFRNGYAFDISEALNT